MIRLPVTVGVASLSMSLNAMATAELRVAVGEVGANTAVVWVQADRAGQVELTVSGPGEFAPVARSLVANSDYTTRFPVAGLKADSEYRLTARFTAGVAPLLAHGRFRTAPAANEAVPVRFAFGSDVAGQNVCRDTARGFPIFGALLAQEPAFFVALGDMIYADGQCMAQGRYGNAQIPGAPPAIRLADFRQHWRYTRSDEGLTRLLAEMPYYAIWDDHEVLENLGPAHDRRLDGDADSGPLMPVGRRAFVEQNPFPDTRIGQLYRSFRWGRHVELFLLDTRSYRHANSRPDTVAEPKTMLGSEQRKWLIEGLTRSDATWLIVASSVPLSIPRGSQERGRDGWANAGEASGFERELLEILGKLRAARRDNTVWLSGDAHFATAFRYRPFEDSPEFVLHEVVVGPLNAGLFPSQSLDETLAPERLFFHGPKPDTVSRLEDALQWMNFGQIEVDAEGRLRISVINATGEAVFRTAVRRRLDTQ